ncbi:hypothetical protein Q3G72_006706 [Acer saccharum]|nr:hypothetical protein Q3G72_006706 [Acer saccharum]
MTTAYELMESLQAMFGQPSKQKRHEAVRSAMTAHMKEGSSVREHFKSNYGMNKLKFNLTQLLNELTTFESMIKDNKSKTGEANVASKAMAKPKKK